ncbi:MAG: hypothetical protein OXN85_15495 [Gemmatimonadetes bacterium]|nr:hypothetical protein [Candidatus Palauibacter australiensis]
MTVSAPRKDNFNLVAAGLALLHFLLGLVVFEPTLFPGGDNAAYLILGEALRTGEGYRDLYLPGTPLHDKYPPLLPSLLALSGWVGGVIVAKVLMLAFTSGVVWVTAHFGRRWAGKGPALAAAGVLAVNPTLLEYGHYILSEAPFTLFVTLALWMALRGDRKSVVFALVAAALAFMTRTAGLALLVALPLAWLLEGRRVRALGAAGAAAAVIGGWVLYQRWVAPGRGGYLAELLLANPYDAGAGSVEVGGLVVRAAENSWRYVESVLPQTLAGPGTLSGAGGVSIALGLAVAAAALAGWALRAREGLRPVEVFAFLYTGIILTWPTAWTDRRFLLPLLPVLLVFAFVAVWRLASPSRAWIGWAAAIVIAVFGVSWVAGTAPDRIACAASYRAGRPCDRPAEASLYAAARWARDHTPPDAIIVNRKPRLFYWHARRGGDAYAFSSDPATVMRGLEEMGADYVVVDQISATTGRYLVPAIQAYQTRFELVYGDGEPPSYIFRLLPAPASTD